MNMNDETREEVGPNAMGNVLSSASAAVAATAVPLQKPPHSTITPPLWQPTPCTAPLDRFGSLAGLVASFALLQQKKKNQKKKREEQKSPPQLPSLLLPLQHTLLHFIM